MSMRLPSPNNGQQDWTPCMIYDRKSAPKRSDTWYLYGLLDSREIDRIRYVGITNNPYSRLGLHISQARKEGWKKSRWIQSVIESGGDILLKVIDFGLSQDDAKSKEISTILEMRASGSELMNLTDGGDGVVGQVQSVETRQKRSATMIGHKKSPLHGQRVSAALKGRKATQETKENMSAAHLRRYRENPMAAEVQRNNTLLRFADTAERERYSLLTSERFNRPGEREKHSKLMKSVMADGEVAKKIRATRLSNGPQANNKTGFKGVFLEKKSGKYIATLDRKRLGCFSDSVDAALAYNNAALANYGCGVYLNNLEN